jgi:hypothetical protein
MATKPPNPNSNVLVAIAKIETKLDILTVDVKDLKDGMKADIEFLKVDKISRADAVRNQTESMSQIMDIESVARDASKRLTNLEDSRISYRAQLKVWIILGGGMWTVATIVFSAWLANHF